MSKPMIHAKYPLAGTSHFLEIVIFQPEPDPESTNNDYCCDCRISGPEYVKTFHAYGIDQLQCVWLALRRIRDEISGFEENTKLKCEYCYFQEFEK